MIHSFIKGMMYGIIFYFYYIISAAMILMCFVIVDAWEINIPEDYDEWNKTEKALYMFRAIIEFPVVFVKTIAGIE